MRSDFSLNSLSFYYNTLNNADSRPLSFTMIEDCYMDNMHRGGSGGCKMQEVHAHESRCLRRRQYRLIFIPSTLSCVLGSGPDAVRLTQHSGPLTYSFLLSFSFYFLFCFCFSCSRSSYVDVSLIFPVQQTTYRIGNHVYYCVWLRPIG